MSEQRKVQRFMQVSMKNGKEIHIGVKGISEYKAKRGRILNGKSEFITLIEPCTVRRSDVSIIEYFEQEAKEVVANGC